MNEEFIASAWLTLCDGLVEERREHGEGYVLGKWSLSKTRLKVYCLFSKFCRQCRKEELPMPGSPDRIEPLLLSKQKEWMDKWAYCLQQGATSKDQVKELMGHKGWIRSRKASNEAIARNKVRNAARAIASLNDGYELVELIGPEGLGPDWPKHIEVCIDADQARLDARNE